MTAFKTKYLEITLNQHDYDPDAGYYGYVSVEQQGDMTSVCAFFMACHEEKILNKSKMLFENGNAREEDGVILMEISEDIIKDKESLLDLIKCIRELEKEFDEKVGDHDK